MRDAHHDLATLVDSLWRVLHVGAILCVEDDRARFVLLYFDGVLVASVIGLGGFRSLGLEVTKAGCETAMYVNLALP